MNLRISKLLFVKADWDRTFLAEIFNDKSEDGKEIVRGTVMVKDVRAWSAAETVDQLGNYLDDACILILDYKIHEKSGKTQIIAGNAFHLN